MCENTWRGYDVPEIILLHSLKGAMWLDCSKDTLCVSQLAPAMISMY